MIGHKHKFIFIHINKAGGTSIEHTLKKSGGQLPFKNQSVGYTKHNHHVTAEQYSNTEYWDTYFKFTIVRNPWDKECSDFHYHNKLRLKRKQPLIESFRSFFQLDEQKTDSNMKIWHSNQLDWLYSDNKKMELDFIGRFENLQEDFNTACDKIGIPQQQLPHTNKSNHKHYTEYYDEETKSIVAEKYAKDIEYFGYKFGE